MHSIHNKGKSIVTERSIRCLKTKIYKFMTSISNHVHFHKLDDIVNEYNNTYHRKIKMKPVDVRNNTYIDSKKEFNNKNPKCKNIFATGSTPNWSKEVFVIKKVKNTVPWTYVINDLNDEEIIGTV